MNSKFPVTIPKAQAPPIPVFSVSSLDDESIKRLALEAQRLQTMWSEARLRADEDIRNA